ncbi:condensation domain-containing protein [Saccharopolyspora pogona]|uniref:condensation domain-containing protein n=1 Tax=Saccharopolyspora pogona TaxID=333966 RepID=UPI001689D08B|nr:condensation domain-containing protein [Saccharopolyspora pogona]
MKASKSDSLPLTATQQLVWLAQRLAPASPLYNATECVEIHGPLDTSLLEMAVRTTATEADALNACFVENKGHATQLLRSAADWPFPVIDLCGDSDPRTAANRWKVGGLAKLVDLANGPVFGHALFILGPEHHVWYHRCHHIALDGYGFPYRSAGCAALHCLDQ